MCACVDPRWSGEGGWGLGYIGPQIPHPTVTIDRGFWKHTVPKIDFWGYIFKMIAIYFFIEVRKTL